MQEETFPVRCLVLKDELCLLILSDSAATLNCALEDSAVFVFCFVLGEILH